MAGVDNFPLDIRPISRDLRATLHEGQIYIVIYYLLIYAYACNACSTRPLQPRIHVARWDRVLLIVNRCYYSMRESKGVGKSKLLWKPNLTSSTKICRKM